MIECIFTLDYEIFGDGSGSLREHIFNPAEKLKEIFLNFNVQFIPFIEVAELEMIERYRTDEAINLVLDQIRNFYKEKFELGLHIHPQWYNADYCNGKWQLDYSEYNLCILSQERIAEIIGRGIAYFQKILDAPEYTPLSFRAGNWLLQPTQRISNVLAQNGIKIDSSVFKGGLQHRHRLDYRRALRNGYSWKFNNDVNIPVPEGSLIELPIYTKMVPPWKMLTAKRVSIQKKSISPTNRLIITKMFRLFDFFRFRLPLKFDFCRMTIEELIDMMTLLIIDDQQSPQMIKPIVLIGHTKDLINLNDISSFLEFLINNHISISNFNEIYKKYYHSDSKPANFKVKYQPCPI